MKFASLPGIKLAYRHFPVFFIFAALTLFLTVGLQTGQTRQAQLSLADILVGLRSKKVTLAERNKLLTDAVIERGITFSLTPEIEKELTTAGASSELIEAIRRKSPVIKAASTPEPTPVPSPVATPVPTPVPTPIPTPKPPDFTFYQKRADENAGEGKHDLALVDYNKAIELNPKAVSLYLSRGRIFYSKKDYASAVADYNQAIELNPESTLYFIRGDSYEKMGELHKAAADYQKAVELDANNESAKNNLKRLQDELAKQQSPKPETPTKPETPKTTAQTQISQASSPVNFGALNNLALRLATPVYPPFAQKMNIQGQVTVQITLDAEGNVLSAKAADGPPMLRTPSEEAARKSKFKPARVENQPVKATGFIIYNFKGNQNME
jgi:TonB family protein